MDWSWAQQLEFKEYLYQVGQSSRWTCHKDAAVKTRKDGFWMTEFDKQGEI